MIDHLDRLPKEHEDVTLEDGSVLTALKVARNRIMLVKIKLSEHIESDEEETGN